MNASGVWRGYCNGRIGLFKFLNVEVIPDQKAKLSNNKLSNSRINNGKTVRNGSGPKNVDELLLRIGLIEYTSVFMLNGYVF